MGNKSITNQEEGQQAQQSNQTQAQPTILPEISSDQIQRLEKGASSQNSK